MTVYFQGSELEAFTPNAAAGTHSETTTAANREAAYSRAAATAVAPGSGWLDCDFTALSELWLFVVAKVLNNGAVAANQLLIAFMDASGNTVARLVYATTSRTSLTLQYWNGSAFVSVAGTYDHNSSGSLAYLNIHIKKGAAGQAEWYVGEALIGDSGAISLASFGDITRIRLYKGTTSTSVGFGDAFSQAVVSNVSNLGWRALTVPPVTAGTDTDGTGTNADITETTTDTATLVELAAAGNKRSGKAAARTLTGVIKGVTATGLIKRVDATGPQQVKPYLLIGGVRYYGTTFALTTGFIRYQYTWNLNPATGAAWTTAQANDANMEIGWEAVA